MSKLLRAAVLASILISHAPAAVAYSAIVSIDDLVAESHLVVVGDVISVVESGSGPPRQSVATLRVVETWMGARSSELQFIASPGWFSCDTSRARKGERVVLFLSRDPGESLPRIAHFGRGRMPIGKIGAATCAMIYEVTFARSIPVMKQPAYPHAEGVVLSQLKAFVQRHVSRPAV